jgi:hypothetical protein
VELLGPRLDGSSDVMSDSTRVNSTSCPSSLGSTLPGSAGSSSTHRPSSHPDAGHQDDPNSPGSIQSGRGRRSTTSETIAGKAAWGAVRRQRSSSAAFVLADKLPARSAVSLRRLSAERRPSQSCADEEPPMPPGRGLLLMGRSGLDGL